MIKLNYQLSVEDYQEFLIDSSRFNWHRGWMSLFIILLMFAMIAGSILFWYKVMVYYAFVLVIYIVIILAFSWQRILIYFEYKNFSNLELKEKFDCKIKITENSFMYIKAQQSFVIPWLLVKKLEILKLGKYLSIMIYLKNKLQDHKVIVIPVPLTAFNENISQREFINYLNMYYSRSKIEV